jgi:hypothetical protein
MNVKVGKDSVVMGNVGDRANVGDRSVVIGATDSRGNTVLNKPMAVGHGAKAGVGSIAIGAGANAGVAASLPAAIPWYQRPVGIIVLGLVVTIVGGAVLFWFGLV